MREELIRTHNETETIETKHEAKRTESTSNCDTSLNLPHAEEDLSGDNLVDKQATLTLESTTED